MRKCIHLCLLLFSAALLFGLKANGQVFKLALPFKATLNKEIYTVNYVDHDTALGKIKDHNCGDETYDGHQGTDFVLRNFRQMDSGVVITAAAPGRVVYVVDTFFDRNKTSNKLLGYGNYINIKHDSNYYTIYAHLRKHSAHVKVGDSIKVGDTLGLIGASGYAVDPHLHFELWNVYTLIDPFNGGCSQSRSYWNTQPAYDTGYGIIDAGMVNFNATLDTLRENMPTPSYFTTQDSFITFWIHEYGIKNGDTSQIYWYTPKNTFWYSYSYPHTFTSRYYYWWSYIGPVNDTGLWTVYYEINHKVKVTKHFRVIRGNLGTAKEVLESIRIRVNSSSSQWNVCSDRGLQSIDIFSVSGALVKTLNVNDQKRISISQEGFSPGIYIWRVHTLNNVLIKKVLLY